MIAHAHGQHGAHTHTEADYAHHQRPIDNEALAGTPDAPLVIEVPRGAGVIVIACAHICDDGEGPALGASWPYSDCGRLLVTIGIDRTDTTAGGRLAAQRGWTHTSNGYLCPSHTGPAGL